MSARAAALEFGTGSIGEGQIAIGIITSILAYGFHLAIAEISHDIAAPFIDITTGSYVEVVLLAVPDVFIGELEPGRRLNTTQIIVVIIVLIDAVLGVDTNALQLLAHNEVDDAGHGVRAVNR